MAKKEKAGGTKTLTDLPNVSKVLSAVLLDAGISTPDELRALGSKEAFLRIRLRDNTACFCKLCALEGAIRGVRWHNLEPKVKEDLKGFFNTL